MFRMLPSILATVLWAGTAAAAGIGFAPAADPRLTATGGVADYDAGFDLFVFDALSVSVTDGSGTIPALTGITVFGGLDDPFGPATLDLFGDDPVTPILSGILRDTGSSGSVLELLFDTTIDGTGLFGPRLLFTLDTGQADPFAGFALADATATIAAPVPLPPAMALLAGGTLLLAGLRRARG